MSTIGHNSPLRGYVERIERIDDQMSDLAEDKKEIFQEAKANDVDVKTLRKVLSRRKRRREDVMAEDAAIAEMESNLGIFG